MEMIVVAAILAGVHLVATCIIAWVTIHVVRKQHERDKAHQAFAEKLLSRFTAVANLEAEVYCSSRDGGAAAAERANDEALRRSAGATRVVLR